MGIHRGPNTVNDNLVFGYDDGYNSSNEQIASGRFFKGPAHTNLVEEIDPSFTNTNEANFKAISGEEVVDIPIVGKRTVKYVDYFNNRYAADGSVNSGTTCCPNLFHYFVSGAPYIAVDSGSSYTYSIIYKHTGGYHHPNFMYHYQKDSSNSTLTEGGVSSTSTSRRTHLGDGWYHAWGNIATQATCTQVLLYSFLYNYGAVTHRYYVAAVSLVKNTTGETYFKIPPQLMLEPLGSVGSTSSLIDLKKTSSIDVSNVTFGSTGQPTFDGTDDRILSDTSINLSSYTSLTYEGVLKAAGIGTHDRWFSGTNAGNTGFHEPDLAIAADGQLRYIFNSSGFSSWHAPSGLIIDTTKFNHLVYTFTNAGVIKIYINGVQEYTATHNSGTFPSNSKFMIGTRFDNNTEAVTGSIPVVKVYSKALTADEVKQNYNAYKNRFDL